MTTKGKNKREKEDKVGKVKVGKLSGQPQPAKDLSVADQKQIKGGGVRGTDPTTPRPDPTTGVVYA